MDIDKILKEKFEEIKVPYIELDIDKLMQQRNIKDKAYRKSKINFKTYSAIVACLVIVIVSLTYLNSRDISNIDDVENNKADTENIGQSEEIVYNTDEVEVKLREYRASNDVLDIEKTKIIDIIYNYDAACYEESSTSQMYSVSHIVIAKVNDDGKSTCIDKIYDSRLGIYDEIGYTFTRTIYNLEIKKVLKGDLNVGEVIEFKRKGGMVDAEDYLKGNNSSSLGNVDIAGTYNDLVSQGYKCIYINEEEKGTIKLEKGKTYLFYIIEKAWGEHWHAGDINSIMLYNEADNTILNNLTGEYEPLESIIP